MSRTRRPKLGQHFLADSRYRWRILEALELRSEDLVIEIGAGRGAMTELLAQRARRVIAIEIDPRLAESLQQKMRQQASVEILRADILAIDLSDLCRRNQSEKCFVFGNLPYYITSPILHHLFASRDSIRAMGLLVQREVAARLTASPGVRSYGYLSVLTQVCSRPRVVLDVPPGAFSPPPKVHSALVRFEIHPRLPVSSEEAGEAGTGIRQAPPPKERGAVPLPEGADQEKFLEFVKRCFAHKRKKLLNNLSVTYPRQVIEQVLATLPLPPNTRAEQLSIDQLASLYRGLLG